MTGVQRPKKYFCPVDGCDKAYTRPSLLAEHSRSHDNTRPFSCEVCYKSFLRESHLKSHRWIHADEKPLRCGECDKRFITNQQLQRHLQSHERKRLRAAAKLSSNEAQKPEQGFLRNLPDSEYNMVVRNGVMFKVFKSSPESQSSVSLASTESEPASTPATEISTDNDMRKSFSNCPYACPAKYESTKELSDHILETHVLSDTIDVETHLASIKEDLNESNLSSDMWSTWDGMDWSHKRCMEVSCLPTADAAFRDYESLIAHYNDGHGFVPDSLLEYCATETD